MTNPTLTADTITNAQIKALRSEAEAAGDPYQVRLCDVALGWINGGGFANVSRMSEARQACADAVNEARARAADRATLLSIPLEWLAGEG